MTTSATKNIFCSLWKATCVTTLLVSCFLVSAYSQYEVKCDYLIHPERNIDYVKKNAEFWIRNAYDSINGGFYSNLDQFGNVTSLTDVHANKLYKRKSFISQTRHGYGFTRAFMLTGDERYLKYAQSALDFLYKYGWDKTQDGWYCFATENGSLDHGGWWDPNLSKWGFQQHYAMVGILANYEATRDSTAKVWMDKGLNSLYNHMWDSRSGLEGYYSDAALNWSSPTGKGFTTTVDAITTNGELTYLITQDPIRKTRLLQLADIIVKRFIPMMSDPRIKVLYPENYSSDWVVDMNATEGSIGHFLKTAWCLGRAYLCDTTKTEYKIAAKKILDQCWSYNQNNISIWDHTNGGPYNSIVTTTGAWGTAGNNKDYWTLEQGFTGPMINYYITGDPNYLQMADESINFFMQHQVDSINGEIFSELDPTGLIVRSGIKGDEFKSSYHSSEMGYYAYLYSNLYLLQKPADLYYKIAPSKVKQQIVLTPIPMENDRLKIKSATLDGKPFDSFDPDTRVLTFDENQGGKLKVTFIATASNTNGLSQIRFAGTRIYPTLTRTTCQIHSEIAIKELFITDLAGNHLLNCKYDSQNSCSIDLSTFAKGIYLVTVIHNTGEKYVRKIIKQ